MEMVDSLPMYGVFAIQSMGTVHLTMKVYL
jgi:hypothetical protein